MPTSFPTRVFSLGDFDCVRRLCGCWSAYHLRRKLKLFDSVITPTMMYGAGTCTMSAELEKQKRTTQGQMLLLIIQTKQNTTIVRVTNEGSDQLQHGYFESWA